MKKMTLNDLYASEGRVYLDSLAEQVGVTSGFLYHCALGYRRPSPQLCLKLIEVDDRLSLYALRSDVYPAQADYAH